MTAYTLLNQIFYNANKFDVDPKQCEKYMLFQDYVNHVKPIIQTIHNIESIEEPNQSTPIVPRLFQSKKKDQLLENFDLR